VNAALACCTPEDLIRTDIEVAIDFHDEPFYGKQEIRLYRKQEKN
jgi:hypothetical protein